MRFLIETAHATGSRYLALAHSADDNVETVLHHLMRGTGPAGLCGMGSPRAIDEDLVLVRPLLHTRRDLIRTALATERIAWREDASNLDPTYRRNWIRQQLIPFIHSQYPHASSAIERAIEGQRQWRRTIDHLAERWLEDHLRGDHPAALRRDRESDPAIAIAAAQRLWTRFGWPRGEMTQGHWLRLAETLRGDQPERYALPSGVDVIADDSEVKLGRQRGA
jgi:tRNA(Ile)-lysidine synthase